MPPAFVRAWTLGLPALYEDAVRTPGNAKAPGGYAFPTMVEAAAYNIDHALPYEPYEIELPGPFEEVTSTDYQRVSLARHAWHRADTEMSVMKGCGICEPELAERQPDCALLLCVAPFVNPDTGERA